MTPGLWRRIEAAFHDALERAPDARAAYLAELAAEDAELCRHVTALLADEAGAAAFIGGIVAVEVDGLTRPREPVDAAPPLARGTVLDHFMILDRLGAGGMGVVYSAYDSRLDRKVAIKLLRPGSAGDAQARLVREAQAMARLTHANVLTVHEVGAVGSDVFIAMELVAGADLGSWLAARPRSVRAILDVFVQAGRGLLAAHDAGIIHRDFKPGNVLVGEDGRARVTDFGVAKLLTDAAAAANAAGSGSGPVLTADGVQPGTPRYMAPEQKRGGVVDVRADQYAFAVALRESLTGDRSRRLPRWIRVALAPALEPDPAQRYPSLAPLIERLARGPRARRRLLALAAAAAAVVAALALVWRPAPGPLCRGARARLDGVWDPAVRLSVRRSFVATQRPYAVATADHVEAAIDAYADAWVAMHVDACEATAVRGEQSATLLDLRMQCLERRRAALGALTAVYREADTRVVDRAVAAAFGLAPVADCADAAALTAAYPPPDPARRAAVDELRARLDRGQALRAGGRYQEGLAVARDGVADADRLGYPPLRAELLLLYGNFQKEAAPKDAVPTLEQAVIAAAAARDDRTAASALSELVWLLGYRLHRYDEARALRAPAEAALARMGDPPALRANLVFNLGVVAGSRGDYGAARALLWEALARREQLFGPDHPTVAQTLNSLGNVLAQSADFVGARAAFERAVVGFARGYGPDHISVAVALNNLGELEEQQGLSEQALEHDLRANRILVASLGPEHPNLAAALINSGQARLSLGRYPESAADLERAVALRARAFGADSAEAADAQTDLADTYVRLGRGAEAQALLEHALATEEKALGPDHVEVAWPLDALGRLFAGRGDFKRARPLLERAVAIRDKAFGADSVRSAGSRSELAACWLGLGDARRALGLAGPALARLEAGHAAPTRVARARFVLARALWDLGRDPAGARRVAETSRAELVSAGPAGAEDLAAVTRWLAARTSSSAR
jgi:hypothetical protein